MMIDIPTSDVGLLEPRLVRLKQYGPGCGVGAPGVCSAVAPGIDP